MTQGPYYPTMPRPVMSYPPGQHPGMVRSAAPPVQMPQAPSQPPPFLAGFRIGFSGQLSLTPSRITEIVQQYGGEVHDPTVSRQMNVLVCSEEEIALCSIAVRIARESGILDCA